jgi:ABC-type sugar transport system substrate-binding protein
MKRFWLCLMILLLCAASCARQAKKTIKLGYLVKQPEEPWFQYEWTWAQKCADKYGFQLIKLGTTDGEKVLSAIDNLGAQGAQGFVICTPDVKLGPAIVAKANQNNLKVISVDDRFVGPDGKFLEDVPHYGVDARTVGHISGQALIDEMKRRNVRRARHRPRADRRHHRKADRERLSEGPHPQGSAENDGCPRLVRRNQHPADAARGREKVARRRDE